MSKNGTSSACTSDDVWHNRASLHATTVPESSASISVALRARIASSWIASDDTFSNTCLCSSSLEMASAVESSMPGMSRNKLSDMEATPTLRCPFLA